MRFAGRIVRAVLVLVVRVMGMAVGVFQFLVWMAVGMALRQM